MIHIYIPGNTDYEHNGDITLLPSAATTHAILNGAWTAELTHPIDSEGRWKYITEEAVVKMPSFNRDQLYRIKDVSKQDSGVTAIMEPIFYDSIGDCWLSDVRPTGKNGQEALDIMLASNSKYSGSSNISKAATAYYQYVNFMEALNGDIDQSFINRWGGEILFDNFTVIVNERVGGDYGVELRYGKNIPQNGMSYEVDIRNVVTRIYPKAYNGHAMTGNGYVDSPLIESYPTIKAAAMTFENVKMREDAQEDDEENGVIVCDTQAELNAALTAQCNAQYDAGLDKPSVTISIDMVLLQNTEQYKDIEILETVSLGDTIHCINNHLGVTTDARVIELEYDSIRKKVSSVVIGDAEYQYFNDVTSSVSKIDSIIRPDGSIMADKVQGILDGIYTQLRLQSTAAQPVDGIAFRVEQTDEDAPLYGCMIWGTQGIQIANKRTADGRDWDWETAITADGIVANAIITGLLSDKTGRNFWNLDTGEFSLSSAATVGGEPIATQDQTIKNVDVEYASGTSNTTAPTSGWSTDAPQWQQGRYIWQRTVTTMADGTESVSQPTCIQGADGPEGKPGGNGDDGSDGVGVSQIIEQYYLSTSSTTQTGGSWSSNQPAWQKGKYIWTRSRVTWTNGSITNTDPVLAQAINGANENAADAQDAVTNLDDSLDQQGVFNRLTNNGQIQGIFMKDGQLYINSAYLSSWAVRVGGYNNQDGEIEVYDSAGDLIGRWDREGFFTNGRYFAVTEDSRVYSNNPVFAGDLYLCGNLNGTLVDNAERAKASIMSLAYQTSSGEETGNYTMYVARNTTGSGNWYVKSIKIGSRWQDTSRNLDDVTIAADQMIINGDFSVTGEKNRVVQTENYGDRKLSCYEMASPMFGDIGEGKTDENGECVISISDVFGETVNTDIEYQAFLQKEGSGNVWVDRKEHDYFVVKGTPGLKFSWEVKIKQRDYEYNRLEISQTNDAPVSADRYLETSIYEELEEQLL